MWLPWRIQSQPQPPSLFHRLIVSPSLIRSFSSPRAATSALEPPPDSDRTAVLVYYTILRGLAVAIDERFREELQRILVRRSVPLPSVFLAGVYIGGADEVRKLYESGELHELIGRLQKSQGYMCDLCGGLRFVVCDECDGSHKVFRGEAATHQIIPFFPSFPVV